MDFKVLISEAAMTDLAEIVDFIARDDVSAAERLGDKLLSEAFSLATHPQRHRLHTRRDRIWRMLSIPISSSTKSIPRPRS